MDPESYFSASTKPRIIFFPVYKRTVFYLKVLNIELNVLKYFYDFTFFFFPDVTHFYILS